MTKTTRVQGAGHEHLTAAIKGIKGRTLKVGWVADKRYPNSEMTTASVGYIAEKGSSVNNIPPRPIMRPVINEQIPLWQKIVRAETKKIASGKQDWAHVMEVLGLKVAADFRRQITQIQEPPLADATIRGRLRQTNAGALARRAEGKRAKTYTFQDVKDNATYKKPLVFTKVLLNSLTHLVEKE